MDDLTAEKEYNSLFIKMLKFFAFPFLLIVLIYFLDYRFHLQQNPIFKLLFIIIIILFLISFGYLFYQVYKSLKTSSVEVEKEQEATLFKIEINPYQNPIILKYKILPGVIIFSLVLLFIALIHKDDFLIIFYVWLFFAVSALISLTRKEMIIYLGTNHLIFSNIVPLQKSSQSYSWETIFKYYKKVEYREKDKGVVIYTTLPPLIQDDNFSPIRYMLGRYANIFIPVNNRQEADYFLDFIQKHTNQS